MEDLVIELIKIKAINLVEKESKNGNKWKEYEVLVDDYEKGVHYSIPLKKKDGSDTAASKTYEAKMSEWQKEFREDNSVEVGVAVSIKENNWSRDGKSGTSYYKTIRFFKDPIETRNELSKLDSSNSAPEKDRNSDPEEIDVEDIPFN